MKRLLACMLIIGIVASLVLVPVDITAGIDKAAEKILYNVERLYNLTNCRYEVLSEAAPEEYSSELEEIWQLIMNGSSLSSIAKSKFEEGNYTEAKRLAVLSIVNLGRALRLESTLARDLNINFSACRLEMTPVPPVQLRERIRQKIGKEYEKAHALKVAFNVTEDRKEELLNRINELINKIDELEEDGILDPELAGQLKANFTLLKQILEINVTRLIEEGRLLLEDFNVSEAAHRLAAANKLLGLVTSSLHRIGYKLLLAKGRALGIALREDEVKGLLKRKRFEHEIRSRLENIREKMEERLKHVRGKTRKMLEKVREKLEKTPPGHAKGMPRENQGPPTSKGKTQHGEKSPGTKPRQ